MAVIKENGVDYRKDTKDCGLPVGVFEMSLGLVSAYEHAD